MFGLCLFCVVRWLSEKQPSTVAAIRNSEQKPGELIQDSWRVFAAWHLSPSSHLLIIINHLVSRGSGAGGEPVPPVSSGTTSPKDPRQQPQGGKEENKRVGNPAARTQEACSGGGAEEIEGAARKSLEGSHKVRPH